MVRLASVAFLLSLALLGLGTRPALAADGAQLFGLQCRICHSGSSTSLAPSLAGVWGAKIAGREDFNYSPALKAKEGTWTDANLDAFLASPQTFAPGGKMFVAPQSEESRLALIDYLKTLK